MNTFNFSIRAYIVGSGSVIIKSGLTLDEANKELDRLMAELTTSSPAAHNQNYFIRGENGAIINVSNIAYFARC